MNHCSACGNSVSLKVPNGDSSLRYICEHCGKIHYQNPKMVVGCLATWDGKILLCRRAIPPRPGLWTLPGGYLENFESASEGAKRETLEEANAKVEIGEVFTFSSLPYINEIHVYFLANLIENKYSPTIESLEVRLFHINEIPWSDLAFSVVEMTLRKYVRLNKENDKIVDEVVDTRQFAHFYTDG